MKLVISMICRNEASRHLQRTLDCVTQILETANGVFVVTDDASKDKTPDMCLDAGAVVQRFSEPRFWEHEGKAREEHYRFTEQYCDEGDWILSIDADETVNRPEIVPWVAMTADSEGCGAVGMPLYEFWTDTHHRVDGYWFGSKATRLYKYQRCDTPAIRQREMACGSEPMYVRRAKVYQQDALHLLHWGYLNHEDRKRKHEAYTQRLGGHGHNNAHVDSIIGDPTLREYAG